MTDNAVDRKLRKHEQTVLLLTLRQAASIVDSGSVELQITRTAASEPQGEGEQVYKAVSKAITEQFHNRFAKAIDRIEALEGERKALAEQLEAAKASALRVTELELTVAKSVKEPARQASVTAQEPAWLRPVLIIVSGLGLIGLIFGIGALVQLSRHGAQLAADEAALVEMSGGLNARHAPVVSLTELATGLNGAQQQLRALDHKVRTPPWIVRHPLGVGETGDAVCVARRMTCLGIEPVLSHDGIIDVMTAFDCEHALRKVDRPGCAVAIQGKKWKAAKDLATNLEQVDWCADAAPIYVNCVDWTALHRDEAARR